MSSDEIRCLEGKLWAMRAKLKCLGDLLQGHNSELVLDNDAFYGLGQILLEIVEEFHALAKAFPLTKEETSPRNES